MAAPTEEEIRAAVAVALERSRNIDIGAWVADLADPIHYSPPGERGESYGDQEHLWDDLRHTEAEYLANLIEGIYVRADEWEAQVIAKITDALVAAALTFAAEYPEAPRAERKVAA